MTDCIFWIATKDHFQECVQSSESVKHCMPYHPRILLTPDDFNHSAFTHITKIPLRQYPLWYLDFVNYMNLALNLLDYDKFLFLDTDTYMIEPVPEVFNILDRFDIVSTIAPGRIISPTQADIPECFAEYNTGVLAFRKNTCTTLFRVWLNIYKSNPGLYGENDQAPLREAIFMLPVRPYVLPLEYNCRFGFGGQAAGNIKILHGRSDNIKALAENINKDTGIRGWRRGDFE